MTDSSKTTTRNSGRGTLPIDKVAVEKILAAALGEGRSMLFEHEIYDILEAAGFTTPRHLFAADPGALGGLDLSSIPGGEVVCKLISEQMPHRTEHGGIRFTAKTPEALAEAFEAFGKICVKMGIAMSGMLVVERLDIRDSIPYQLLISLRQDPAFGPVVVLGLGGTGTEVYQDGLKSEKGLFIASAKSIIEGDGLLEGLGKTMFFPIISGKTRITGRPLAEPSAIVDAMERFAMLAEAFSASSLETAFTIEELEVNPLQITSGGALVPLDALIKISSRKMKYADPPAERINKLLNPESVLVIGVSDKRPNMGRIILRNIISVGRIPKDRIWLLHKTATEIDGCRAWPSIDALPGRPDLVVFTIPAGEESVALLEDMIKGDKTESIILITGGFGETADGQHLDRRIREAVDEARSRPGGGTVLNGPNCMGIVSWPGGYNTFFLPDYKLAFNGKYGGNVAVVSQSGAWLVTLLSTLATILNPRYMITVGNQMDLTVTDYLMNLKDDPGVEIFCLYLEGLKPGDGARFLDVARKITRAGKKVIVYKAGRTAEGAAAAASHTAAMATDHDVFSRLVAGAGIYEASSLEDMEDAVKVLSLLAGRKAAGNRVGISSDAGYECSVAADHLYSMKLAEFSAETMEKLAQHLTGLVDIHNPVDATPAIFTPAYGEAAAAIVANEGTDCAVISNVAATATQENLPAGPGHKEDITREASHPNTLIRIFKGTEKPMVVCMNEGRIYDPAVRMMEEAGVPVFRKIDRAMKAMDVFIRFGRNGK